MPWNNQSGGPWGAGGKNPTPPDLEELLRRGQNKLRTVLPGGNLGGKATGPRSLLNHDHPPSLGCRPNDSLLIEWSKCAKVDNLGTDPVIE